MGNGSSYYVGEERYKQQTRAGWHRGKPGYQVRITYTPDNGQTPRFRIPDKVPRSKWIDSRLNERELATLQERRGNT